MSVFTFPSIYVNLMFLCKITALRLNEYIMHSLLSHVHGAVLCSLSLAPALQWLASKTVLSVDNSSSPLNYKNLSDISVKHGMQNL